MCPRQIFERLSKNIMSALGAMTLTVSLAGLAHGQTVVDQKIAADLRAVINAGPSKNINWVKKVKGEWLAKVLVVSSNSSDPELKVLRQAVTSMGGSVIYRYVSVPAISVVLPLQSVSVLAALSDVSTISPNRMTAKTDSFIEKITGALSTRATTTQRGVDGAGVGIAVLDSGVMRNHVDMLDASGATRVVQSLNFLDADAAQSGVAGKKGWGAPGADYSTDYYPGSKNLDAYLNYLQRGKASKDNSDDPYGHGTHVASVAAGTQRMTNPDTTGIAPKANIFDLRVLNEEGVGEVSDVLAAIDWMLYYQREYNIRVANLSLASDSTESYLTDPLCRAARAAVAAGITVVVAAGNFGQNIKGQEVYGSIGAPGNEPSVITVGSVNSHDTVARTDDTVNFFSSRGPTRGGYVNAAGTRVVDNILKPELVAPGNKILSAASLSGKTVNSLLMNNPGNGRGHGRSSVAKDQGDDLMVLSGTSIAAPQVAGAAALLIQANPGLTPALIKSILQYTAQALPNANLVQQGTGLLNVEGAVRLAGSLRQDTSSAIAAGKINVGDTLLATGKTMPTQSTTINGETFNWSRLVFAGGSSVFTGDELFTRYQGFYDPKVLWVRDRVKSYNPIYWSQPISYYGVPLRLKGVAEIGNASVNLLSLGVRSVNSVAGASNFAMATGLFMPTLNLANGVSQGTGVTMAETLRSFNGIVQFNGVVIGNGVTMAEGFSLGTGAAMAEGVSLAETVVLSESGSLAHSQSGKNVAQGEQ
jgi:serine protease AprX